MTQIINSPILIKLYFTEVLELHFPTIESYDFEEFALTVYS